MPPHEDDDILTLAPSIRTERLDTIKRIFHVLDNESISCWQLAWKLNEEKVPTTVGDLWTDAKIRHLFKNPVYIGLPASNKGGQARFSKIVNGQVVRIDSRGKAKHTRNHEDQWIQPKEAIFQPIVDPYVFESVNKKLAPGATRAPKNEHLFLSGLVICSKCGERMFGFTTTRKLKNGTKSSIAYYQCQTRNKFGPDNASGCGFHCTRHDQLETYISKFLKDRGQSLEDMLRNRGDKRQILNLAREGDARADEYQVLLDRMRSRVLEAIDANPDLPYSLTSFLGLPEFSDPDISDGEDDFMVVDAYDHLLELTSDKIKAEIADLERQHDSIVSKVLSVSASKLIEKLNTQAEELEAKIHGLRVRLEPLRVRWDEMRAEVQHLRDRLAEAETAMLRGSNRLKAQAIRACIQRIEVLHEPHMVGKKPTMRLCRVKIVPQVGEPQAIEPINAKVFSNDGTEIPTITTACPTSSNDSRSARCSSRRDSLASRIRGRSD